MDAAVLARQLEEGWAAKRAARGSQRQGAKDKAQHSKYSPRDFHRAKERLERLRADKASPADIAEAERELAQWHDNAKDDDGTKAHLIDCPKCAGAGERTKGNKCVTCNGSGQVYLRAAAKDEAKDDIPAKELAAAKETDRESAATAGGTTDAEASAGEEIRNYLARYGFSEVMQIGSTTGHKGQGGSMVTVSDDGSWSVTGVEGQFVGKGKGLAAYRAR